MAIVRQGFIVFLAMLAQAAFAQPPPASSSRIESSPAIQPEAWKLVVLANQARAAAGAGPLQWDAALAAAALQHCLRMAAEGPIAHQYAGEPDVVGRAGLAGARFSLIEENVAIGPTPEAIHEGWMHSPGHRSNLLNPDVDRVGVAVVASRGGLYAVADYARCVALLTQAQVETAVAALVRSQGLTILADPAAARAYCEEAKGAIGKSQPSFLMRWQDPDLSRLPRPLVDRIATGEYRRAAVGSCPPRGVEGAFTLYRVAVLLY